MRGEIRRHMMVVGVCALCALLSMTVFPPRARVPQVEAQSTTPPMISNIKISNIGATSTIIRWTTNVNSDSVTNFSIGKNLGTSKDPNPSVMDHETILTDLEPATIYFFRVSSADSAGNRSFSATYQFTTPGTEKIIGLDEVVSEEQKLITEKAVEIVDKLTDEKALAIVQGKLQSVGEDVLSPPRILGDPRLDIGTETVTVHWITDKDSNSVVEFASEGEYGGGAYARTEGDAGEYVREHNVVLYGLKPQTVYHYRLTSRPQVGPEVQTDDKTFTTKSILPEIFGVRLQKIEENSATIVWSTQVPAGGLVEYTNMSTKEKKSIGDPSLQVSHTVRLTDLKFRTLYSVVIKARTEGGDEISSQPVTFVTTKDDAPPIIANVTNESTLYPGADIKGQTIVSWDTDESSLCQFFYGQGLTITDENKLSFPEETGFSLKHTQVITEFTPSTVYKFWVECHDPNDNVGTSEDFVLFTPEKEKSIIDVILENFQGTFGWVKNIGK